MTREVEKKLRESSPTLSGGMELSPLMNAPESFGKKKCSPEWWGQEPDRSGLKSEREVRKWRPHR